MEDIMTEEDNKGKDIASEEINIDIVFLMVAELQCKLYSSAKVLDPTGLPVFI